MTPAPQQAPKEYIITEEQVETIHHLFSIPEHTMDDADYMMQDDILAEIRSRPHPAPVQQCQFYPCGVDLGVGDGTGQLFVHGSWEAINVVRGWMREAEAARQAREDVLSLMGDYLAEHIYTCRGISCVDSMKMAKYIGSLRSTQHPGQEG